MSKQAPSGERPRCQICGEPRPCGEEMSIYQGHELAELRERLLVASNVDLRARLERVEALVPDWRRLARLLNSAEYEHCAFELESALRAQSEEK